MLNPAERDLDPEESVSKTGQKPGKRTAQQAKTPKEERFMRFWRAYPRKQSKSRAERVRRRINPDEPLLAKMLTSIERAKTSEGWLKEHGQFIPHPATWLNAKGWEDEFPDGGGNDNGGPGRKGLDLPSDYPNELGE